MFRAREIEEKIENLREEAIREASDVIKRGMSVITAFNTNIDALHFVKSEELRDAVSRIDRKVLLDKMKKPTNRVVQTEDFLAGLLLSMKMGRGIEWIIEDEDVFNWIQENFIVNEYRMGGLAGIVANVMDRLKVGTIYPHVASLPRLQARLFVKSDRIKIPVKVGKSLKFESPLRAVRQDDEPLIHWIFEYVAGVETNLDGGIIAPCSNRFIATWDEKNTRLHIDEGFVKGIREVIEDVDLAVISGYHMMKSEYLPGGGYRRKIAFTKALLDEWKKTSDVKVHLELAHFTDLEILNNVLRYLSKTIDGVGLNEDELAQCINALGNGSLYRTILENPKADKLLEGMLYLCRRLDLKEIVVHMKDFCIGVARKPVEKSLLDAMVLGNCLAATLAVTGDFCDLSEIGAVLKEKKTHISGEGLDNLYMFVRALGKKGYKLSEDFSVDMNEYRVWFTPMMIVEKPMSTVGLGDCFTAGYSLLAYS